MRLYCSRQRSELKISWDIPYGTTATAWDEFKEIQRVSYPSTKRPPWNFDSVLPKMEFLRTVFPSLISLVDDYSGYERKTITSNELPPTITHYGLLHLRIDIKSPLPSTLTSINSEVEILPRDTPLALENFPNLVNVYAPKWAFTVLDLETWHPQPMQRFLTRLEAINDSDVLRLLQKFQPETRQNVHIHLFYVETGQLLDSKHQLSQDEEELGSKCARLAERRTLSDAELNRILSLPIELQTAEEALNASESNVFTPMSMIMMLDLDKENSRRHRKFRSTRKLLSFD